MVLKKEKNSRFFHLGVGTLGTGRYLRVNIDNIVIDMSVDCIVYLKRTGGQKMLRKLLFKF